jgi:hypothetical protein
MKEGRKEGRILMKEGRKGVYSHIDKLYIDS